MNSNKVFRLTCLLMSITFASAAPLENNVFEDFLADSSSEKRVIVKRRVYEDNTDRHLKQLSLSSLVGDLEKSIFASALSLNKVLTDKDVTVSEIKPNDDSSRDVNNTQPITREEGNDDATTTLKPNISLPKTQTVILQTTEKVPQTFDSPTHVIIDRIAIQPHTGGVALIPIFDLKQATKNNDTKKDHEITKITISKTQITSLVTATPESSSISPLNSTSSISTTTEDDTVTTPKNIEQLKEAEEELKEKLAEIEAEPVILSARV